MKAPKQKDVSVEQQLEFKSRDGQTIGMIDAILTLAVALTDRLKNENKRFNRLRNLARTTDEEFAYHSADVLAALQDLRLNEVVRNLIYPENAAAMEIIRAATASLKKQTTLDSIGIVVDI